MFQSTPRKPSTATTPNTSGSMSMARTPVSPVASEAEREQALRDYKVTIEYKHLKSHAPGGVYLVPSFTNPIRLFHGVIFIRRGPYTNGIFRFDLQLPMLYNDINQYPIITFVSNVYNPYVDPVTGQLDIKSAYPRWDPSRHYLVTILTFLKKIFYAKTFDDAMANVEAKTLAATNPIAFRTKVDICVRESHATLFNNNSEGTAADSAVVPTKSSLQFTDENVRHRVIRDLLLKSSGIVRDPTQLTKDHIFAMIEQANKI